MAKGTKVRSALERLAQEDARQPKDVDPEALSDGSADSDVDGSEEGGAAREHYEDVGQSKLRKSDSAPLGPQYVGSRISRNAAEDSDSDDPFARQYGSMSSDNEDPPKDGKPTYDKAFGTSAEDDDDEEMDDFDGLNGAEGSEEEEVSSSEDDASAEDDDARNQVRSLLAKSQSTLTANIAQAASTEAAKGRAIRSQRKTFDALLNTRIQLQKGLVATNSFPYGLATSHEGATDGDATAGGLDYDEILKSIEASEATTISLLSDLSALRNSSLSATSNPPPAPSEYTTETAFNEIFSNLQDEHQVSEPRTSSTLTKWAVKTRPAGSTTRRRQLSSLNDDHPENSFLENLRSQLTETSRLVSRARTARSCAPLQAAMAASGRKPKRQQEDGDEQARRKRLKTAELEVGELFDDADFYALLLTELIARRNAHIATTAFDATGPVSTEISTTALNARNMAKTHRAGVDVRASKGRKLKYGEHEKLVNFMAPEDRGLWSEERRREFFGGLFGVKSALAEDEDVDEPEEEASEQEEGVPVQGLRLFG